MPSDRLLHTMTDGACTECGLWEPMPYGAECPARLRAALDASPSQAKNKARVAEKMRLARAEVEAVHAERDEALDEVERLRAALDEREADMHMRIRAGYDKTVADSWRAHCATVEAQRDAALALLRRVHRYEEGDGTRVERVGQWRILMLDVAALLGEEVTDGDE